MQQRIRETKAANFGGLMPAVYLTLSLFFGEKAPANPWSATGLEWQTPSPPTVHNFDATPVVRCFCPGPNGSW